MNDCCMSDDDRQDRETKQLASLSLCVCVCLLVSVLLTSNHHHHKTKMPTHCSMFALLLKLKPAQQAMTMLVANMHMLTMRTYRADSV